MEQNQNVNENNVQEIVPSISIQDLHKAYGTKEVLLGLNLDVYEGELFGFIGKNGIGKSTTIDCMIGAKKFQSGVITLEGFDITKDPIAAKRMFGYVASEPTCYDEMTGYDYLEFVASVYDVSEGDFKRNTKYLCERLQLNMDELSNQVSDYSHGMKQKLCLVASLMHNPKIWILDEPTVGLDIIVYEVLLRMIKDFARFGKTVFVTSHNIELVSKVCDRVAIINDGVVANIIDFKKEPLKRRELNKIFFKIYTGEDAK